MDLYGTHQEALAWAAAQIDKGPVLEVGAGWWSTPWLHGFCEASERLLLTLEGHSVWLMGIAPLFANDRHRFVSDVPDMDFALALVDGGDPDRARYVRALNGRCQYLVCHDTEESSRYNYPEMEQSLAEWPNRRDFQRLWPHTTVVWS